MIADVTRKMSLVNPVANRQIKERMEKVAGEPWGVISALNTSIVV